MEKNLIILEQTESTQDIAFTMAKEGASEGVAVMTCNQTSGRGRLGRSWSSPAGRNLALTLILRPNCQPEQAPLYGLLSSVATSVTVEQFCPGILAQVKWPNDVIIANRKIAGILPQAQIINHGIEFILIGLGLNINCKENDFPPELRNRVTSMATHTSLTYDIMDVANCFLDNTALLYEQSKNTGFASILDLWRHKWAHRGHSVIRSEIEGIAEDIDELGSLLIRTDENRLIRVSSGEVNF